MRFVLSAEQRQFGETVHEVLAAGGGWAELARVGVIGLVVPEALGGQGAGAVEVVVAAEELGHHAVAVGGLAGFGGSRWTGVVPGTGSPAVTDTRSGSSVVAGPGPASPAVTDPASGSPSAAGPGPGSPSEALWRTGLAETGLPRTRQTDSTTRPGSAAAALRHAEQAAAELPRIRQTDTTARPDSATRPDSAAAAPGHAELAETELPRSREVGAAAGPGPVTAAVPGSASVAAALGCAELAAATGVDVFELEVLVCAAQLLGAARAMLELAVEHAKKRRQFGHAIGAFQAVQHRLADVHVALELARPLVFGAALSLSARDTSAARVAAADLAQRAAHASLQVHGALGYTQEYSLGRFILLARRLRSVCGTQDFHRGRVMAALAGSWTWQ